MKKINNYRGFTLVELLVVITILAVLSTIAMVQFAKYRESSYKIVAKTDLRNSVTAIIGFYTEFSSHPDDGFCGYGPSKCDLYDGIHKQKEGIIVSEGVKVEWSINKGGKCANGLDKIQIKAVHSKLKNWEVVFDSCSGSIIEVK